MSKKAQPHKENKGQVMQIHLLNGHAKDNCCCFQIQSANHLSDQDVSNCISIRKKKKQNQKQIQSKTKQKIPVAFLNTTNPYHKKNNQKQNTST